MTTENWLNANAQYLTASLAWLRLRLERLNARTDSSSAQAPVDEAIAEANAARGTAASCEPAPALVTLSAQLGLSLFEQEVLLLCVAMELDTRVPALCARAQGEAQRPYPTFALALSLFDNPRWDALSPAGPLRFWRLLEIHQPAATPLTLSALRADERIVNYVKGLNHMDDRLTPCLVPVDRSSTGESLAPSQQVCVQTILQQLASPRSTAPTIVLLGADRDSKQAVAQAVVAELGHPLFRLDVNSLPQALGEAETWMRLLEREQQLRPVAWYVDAQELEVSASRLQVLLKRFLARQLGLSFLDVGEAQPQLAAALCTIDVAKPNAKEQRSAWAAALGRQAMLECEHAADVLGGQFRLNLAEIARIASRTANRESLTLDRVWDGCCALTRPKLDRLAQRLEARATWDDLVLPEEPTRLLRQIANQVEQRHRVYETWGFSRKSIRGQGLTVLFTGESGTGKTMAAEVIANALRLSLYRIDLSSVVSKYIGETEKNLRQLFDAAEDGGAILFFDEADALFGKRSEVKDSHDRYANIEINYLLQRMESYRGLAILATNMKSALDSAFMRRLRFIVPFSFPGQAERKAIWQKVFPPDVPKAELDLDRLARLNLTGGNIYSIALNTAFLAAQSNEAVSTALTLMAARSELRKLDRPFNEGDFR